MSVKEATRRVLRVRYVVLFPGLLILIWWLASHLNLVSPVFLPPPQSSLESGIDFALNGELLADTLYTVSAAAIGWLLALVGGIVLALLLTRSELLLTALTGPLDFARSLPAAALIPPATLILGFGRSMEIPIIVAGAIWPVLLNVIHGLQQTSPRLLDVARNLGMTRFQRIWKIELPSALPETLLGARTSLSVAIIVAIVAEMVGGAGGLGARIILAGQQFDSGLVYALIVVLGVIGLCANALIGAIEKRALSWRVVAQH